MLKSALIEQIRREVYGGQPTADADITKRQVNQLINQGLAIAAKNNYAENYKLEGVGFVNNSFYSTFKGIAITEDENFLYKFTMPSIPLGIGSVDAISRIVFKDNSGKVSFPAVLLTESQVAVQRSMRPVPNKILCYPEGGICFVLTAIIMSDYTASITLISGGSETDMDSTLNVPNDAIPIIIEYCMKQLMAERMTPVDAANDGQSAVKTI